MSLGQGLGALAVGLGRGLQAQDERNRIAAERARMEAAAAVAQQRQARLDQQQEAQTTLQNRMRLADQARQMAGAGFTPYEPGTVNGEEAQQAEGLDAVATTPMLGAAGAATRLLGQARAQRLAGAQGGYVKTGMSEQERIRQDERDARLSGQAASLQQQAHLARERMQAETERARESNQTRRDLAGIAAAARSGPPAAARTLPMGVESAISENATVLGAIDQAEQMLNAGKGKGAFGRVMGMKRTVGLERWGATPEDVELAAVVGNVASQQIKLRSGAAVTASEWPRLRPFLPVLDGPGADDAATVGRKLQKIREIIADETNARADYYERQGYAVPAVPGRTPRTGDVRRDRPAPGPMDDPGFVDFLRSRGIAP